MINVLAGSENDAALIARAAGSAARIVTDAAQFTNGDGPLECLILGCRHPIPAETIELLQPGDELLSVNGRDTRHGAPFPPGSEGTWYTVSVQRQGTEVLTLRLQLAKRPPEVLEPVSEAPIGSPADWNCPALSLG
ncbi:hypothetical protein [Candidatus Palauibacter polyketidifaciens]|uniref:hypothetical protein n=1 Tax=Candidatus Palauibacter polyketidifaciens TaxID=3056740 RepID=UPI0023A03157|nr:hypothetical protein [Candidatus Palauibacter polyketidifaciens]MDE2719961.1 hypothetical protein [Candidatus Palauibacter polyketidifaciens]